LHEIYTAYASRLFLILGRFGTPFQGFVP
jgi:hypothetical protein